MKKYKAITFDFDLTIADTAKVITYCINLTLKEFGYEVCKFEDLYPHIGNIPEIMLSIMSGEKDPVKLKNMRDYYRKIAGEHMIEMTTFFPGVIEGIKRLSDHGYKIGILSLKLHQLLEGSLEKYGILQYIDIIMGNEDVKKYKPDPDGIFKIVEELDIDKSELLYIGDSLIDQNTALNAGVDFCALLLGSTPKDKFDSDKVIKFYNDFYQLCDDFII